MLINGRPAQSINAGDRGLAYGDGLFETIRIAGGQPVFLARHMARLARGCERLGITVPVDELNAEVAAVLADSGLSSAVVKIIVSRGAGGRGYRPDTSLRPNRIVSISKYIPDGSAWQEGVRAMVCDTRLGTNPALAGIKHLNRLEQVMAARELGDDYAEGLMMNVTGELIEGTRSNLFVVDDERLVTPDLTACGVAGVMREFLMERKEVSTGSVPLSRISSADEIFVCNSVFGIWPVGTLVLPDGKTVTREPGVLTRALQRIIADETGIGTAP